MPFSSFVCFINSLVINYQLSVFFCLFFYLRFVFLILMCLLGRFTSWNSFDLCCDRCVSTLVYFVRVNALGRRADERATKMSKNKAKMDTNWVGLILILGDKLFEMHFRENVIAFIRTNGHKMEGGGARTKCPNFGRIYLMN